VPVVPTPEPTPWLEAVPGTLSTSVGPPALMPLSVVSPSAAGVAGSASGAGSVIAGSGSDTAAGAGSDAADGVATTGVPRLGESGPAVLTGVTADEEVTPPVAAPLDKPPPLGLAAAADLMLAAAA